MADFYAARAGTNAGAPLDGFLTAVHTEMPIKTFSLDVALIDGEIGIVELNPLMLGQIGLFACDPTRLTAAVLRACGLAA